MDAKKRTSSILVNKVRKNSKDITEKKSIDTDPTSNQRAALEKAFSQFTNGRKNLEIYKLKQLLKSIFFGSLQK